MATMDQVFIRASKDEIEAIDAFVHLDGYISRSAWIRSHIRKVIDARRGEITAANNIQPVVAGSN